MFDRPVADLDEALESALYRPHNGDVA
jgi:hypothetical protein